MCAIRVKRLPATFGRGRATLPSSSSAKRNRTAFDPGGDIRARNRALLALGEILNEHLPCRELRVAEQNRVARTQLRSLLQLRAEAVDRKRRRRAKPG